MRILVLAIALALPATLFAHGGGLNSYGCHNQTSNSTYHCHSGQLDGQSFSSQQAALDALTALNANTAPTVSIIGGSRTVADTDGINGESLTLFASASDSDGSISSSQWLIGGVVVANGTTAVLSLNNGVTTVTFIATDNDGAMASALATITLEAPNTAPVVSIVGGNRTFPDTDGLIGETIALTATATDNDGSISSTQ